MKLRPAANEPEFQSNYSSAPTVEFLHPGYPGSTVLLELPALDDGGIDFDTALAACGLLAGNRWTDGFFSSERGGTMRVKRPDDGILREPQYFFQLPGPLYPPYAIVPRFSHWRFPHGNLPPLWQRFAAVTRKAGGVTGSCVLSKYGDGLETAHLLPSGEGDWWLSNRMQRYSPTQLFSTDPIDGPANLLTLRADLHRVFVERHFCLVPKLGEMSERDDRETHMGQDGVIEEQKPPQLVVHVFNSTPSGQLPNLWHNRVVHPLPGTVAIQCLFARFAWTILSPGVFDSFLPSTPVPRQLLLWNVEKGEWETETASPEMCLKIWNTARSRSPRKRSAQQPANADEELMEEVSSGLVDSGYFRPETYENYGCYLDELVLGERQEEQPRGRSRKRRRLSLPEEQDYMDSGQSQLRRKMLR